MNRRTVQTLLVGFCLLMLAGCTAERSMQDERVQRRPPPPSSADLSTAVDRLRRQVQRDLDRYVGVQQAEVFHALAGASAAPAAFKRPIVMQALTDPWAGLATLERHGRRIAELAGSRQANRPALPALIVALEAGMGRTGDPAAAFPAPMGLNAEAHLAYLITVFEQAHRLREKALRKLSREEQQFLFEHAASVVQRFTPQIEGISGEMLTQARADRRFCRLIVEQLDYAALIASARVLANLADTEWLERLSRSLSGLPPLSAVPGGVAGEVLLARETPYGLLLIGGPGPNTYTESERMALIIDLDGDDSYVGPIAASATVQHGNSLVIDLSGNDSYHAAPLGLATGRLGVGLLIDRAGDDSYHLADGAGGTGFAGLGILNDQAGNDQYIGATFTQGAAFGGFGFLLDEAGDDTYTSFEYAIGFGGPVGVGALVDVAGDDRYQCGDKYPSTYNAADAPDAAPGDPRLQYDCFGLGTGSGKRVFTKDPEHLSYGLAGGWGLLLDLGGNDRYRGANFSQGAGYFFGVGTQFDLTGDDEHGAARYGLAAGAHDGVGLFIDSGGDDHYTSTGPVYNGGAAWDSSVMLGIDAGTGHDRYDLRQSRGLGLADHQGWGLFIEEGGNDRYIVPVGMGAAFDGSLGGFFDLAGQDDYTEAPQSGQERRENGRTVLDPPGGLFVDR